MSSSKHLLLLAILALQIHCESDSSSDVIISSAGVNPLTDVGEDTVQQGETGDVTQEAPEADGSQTDSSVSEEVTDAATLPDTPTDTEGDELEVQQPENDGAGLADVTTTEDTSNPEEAEDVQSTEDAGPEEVPDAGTEEPTDFAGPGPFPFSNGEESNLQVDPIGGLNVLFYYPETDGTFPLVVFGPGFQLTAAQFDWVGEHLASHGYAVLIPTFGDNFLAAIDHVDLAAAMSSLIDEGISPSGIFNGQVNPELLALSGHSRGGKSAILAAINDPRVKAVVTLDPVDTVGGPFSIPSPENPSVTPELMDGLTVPTGFVGAGKGGEGFQPCAPQDENYHAYFVEAASPSYEWVLPQAGHNDFAQDLGFLEASLCPSSGSPETAQSFARGVMAAFLNVHLMGDSEGAAWLDGDKIPAGIITETK